MWDELGVDGRERLRRDGLVVLGTADAPAAARHAARMGAFYMDARKQRLPYVVTLDALAYAVHLAFERALAEVDDAVLAPELDSLIAKLEARLTAEQKGAGVEVAEALQLARGFVAVARGLASERQAAPAVRAERARARIAQEIARVVAHAGPPPSALLGAPSTTAASSVPPGAARPGSFRALAWLAIGAARARRADRGAAAG